VNDVLSFYLLDLFLNLYIFGTLAKQRQLGDPALVVPYNGQ